MINSRNMQPIFEEMHGVGMGISGVLWPWVWGFCGASHRFFFCGNGMDMGIEIQIQSPRQPWLFRVCRRYGPDAFTQ